MIQKFLLCLCCFLCAGSLVLADDFSKANQQFKAGDYSGAAATYENIIGVGGPRASVYYNLGNSYQQLKQYGPAILSYERARLLTPRDPDLLANLALAHKAAAAFEENGRHPWLEAALHYLSRHEWSWLVAGSAIFLGLLAIASTGKFPRGVLRTAAIISGVLFISGCVALYLRRGEATRGIVLSNDATVRLSPFEKAEALGSPGPGRIVQLGAETGGYQYIEVPGAGLRGWMARKEVAAIVPQSSPAGR